MAEEENNEEVKSSSGGKGIIIVLIALVVVLLLAVVGGGYFLYSQGMFSPKDAQTQEVSQKEDDSDSNEMFKANIDDLVLNITNAKGREKLMKLSFAVKSTEASIEQLIEDYRAEIIDVVIAQISARSSEELLTVGGKALLKEELLEEINAILNEMSAGNEDIKANHIKKILFTTFVIK